jgi:hypothetical protein
LVRPVVHAVLGQLGGGRFDGSGAACRRLAYQLPMVAFRPLVPTRAAVRQSQDAGPASFRGKGGIREKPSLKWNQAPPGNVTPA